MHYKKSGKQNKTNFNFESLHHRKLEKWCHNWPIMGLKWDQNEANICPKWLPGGLWAALGRRSRLLVLSDIFGNLDASWGRCGVDLGIMLGAFCFGRQLENLIWWKTCSRLHGCTKNVTGTSVRHEACSKRALGGSWARCLNIVGLHFRSQNPSKSVTQKQAYVWRCFW